MSFKERLKAFWEKKKPRYQKAEKEKPGPRIRSWTNAESEYARRSMALDADDSDWLRGFYGD